jgi:hypothetical protein
MSPTTDISPVVDRVSTPALNPSRPRAEPRIETAWASITEVSGTAWGKAIREVAALSRLPNDWDSYASPPPGAKTVAVAMRFLSWTADFEGPVRAPHVSATPGGGVGLVWQLGSRGIEVSVDPGLRAEYVASDDGQPIAEGSVRGMADLRSHLAWLTTAAR